ASPGRSTPGNAPRIIFAVAIAAPVLPAVANPAALPSRTSRSPTCIEDFFFGWHDVNLVAGKKCRRGMVLHLRADLLFLADQQDVHVVTARSQNGAFDFRFRSAIRAHGVNGYHSTHLSVWDLGPSPSLYTRRGRKANS